MIIGITGNAGSGKDTVAKMVRYYFGNFNLKGNKIDNLKYYLDNYHLMIDLSQYAWDIRKFAYKLKQICAILVGCTPEDFESEEFKSSLLPIDFQFRRDDPRFSELNLRTYRWLLQKVGTEAIRDTIHKDVWVNALMADWKPELNWIISDVRFLNEAQSIKDRGGKVVRIQRPYNPTNLSHSSESELHKIESDYLLDNRGSIQDLYDGVFIMLKHFGY